MQKSAGPRKEVPAVWNENHNFETFNTERRRTKSLGLASLEEWAGVQNHRNEFVIMAINDYYDRHLKRSNVPYLETREKEEHLADRIVQMVRRKCLSTMPALAECTYESSNRTSLCCNEWN